MESKTRKIQWSETGEGSGARGAVGLAWGLSLRADAMRVRSVGGGGRVGRGGSVGLAHGIVIKPMGSGQTTLSFYDSEASPVRDNRLIVPP